VGVLVGVCLSDTLHEVLDVDVEGDAVRAGVDVMGPSLGMVLDDVKVEVGLMGKFLRAVGTGVVYWVASDSIVWHRLTGVEAVNHAATELVGFNKMVVIVFTCVELLGALWGKGIGVLSALQVR
jgi:hypothetical protein